MEEEEEEAELVPMKASSIEEKLPLKPSTVEVLPEDSKDEMFDEREAAILEAAFFEPEPV